MSVDRRAGELGAAIRSRLVLFGFGLIALVVLLVAPTHARAAYVHKPAGTFELATPLNGRPGAIAVDEATGDVYVMQGNYMNPNYQDWIEKFNSEGQPANFSGPGVSIPALNEEQTVHFEGAIAAGDTFTLTCPNSETTAPISWTGESSTLDNNMSSALEAKCGGPYFSVVSGPYNPEVRFEGPYAETNVPRMTCTMISGSGSCDITSEVNGKPAETVHNVIPMPPYPASEGCGSNCYQIAVDNSGGPNQGVIYVSSTEGLYSQTAGISVFLPSGEYVTHITTRSQTEFQVHACGVAVDENGNLVVAHGEGNTEYSTLDELGVESWASHPNQTPKVLGTLNPDVSEPCKTQLGPTGNVYVQQTASRTGAGAIRMFTSNFHEPSGAGVIPTSLRDHSTLVTSGPDRGFVLDSEGNLYALTASGVVEKFDTSDSLIEQFGGGELFTPRDIAIDKATGTIYVADESTNPAAKAVHIYTAFPVANSLTGQFTGETQTSGTLSGEADPAGAGNITSCEFEYTTEALYEQEGFTGATTAECQPGGVLTEAKPVSAAISGLTLEETYDYRLVTEDANGVSNGTVRKFVPHAVINLNTKPASSVEPRSATLNASFTGNGDKTEYFFEYGDGLPGVYTAKTPVQNEGSPTGPAGLSAPLEELKLETTYHFRVVATNGTGTSKGFEESFTTPPAVASLTTEPATQIGQESITLNATFAGTGHDTHYYFEYGPTKEYGMTSDALPGRDAGTTSGPTPISSQITNYTGYTTYHYRVVAENEFGATYGKDLTFTTEEAPLPEISEVSVQNLTPTSVTFSAAVNPNRWNTSWLFEWGESASYESFTEQEEILTGIANAYQPVTIEVGNLKPATTYHYRAVAFNFTGVTNGSDHVFTTPASPKIELVSVSSVGQTMARLSSHVLANSGATTVHFEYGPSTGYGSSTANQSIGEGTLARESAADLTGLTPGTTYHYRVVASNKWGTTVGSDETFTTQAASTVPPSEGNRGPKKCSKGKVKRHGKCVRKHKPKHHKRHHRHHSRHSHNGNGHG